MDIFSARLVPYPRPISQLEYERFILARSALVLPGIYNTRQTVSGVLIDAVATQTPFLAAPQSVFSCLMGDCYSGFIWKESKLVTSACSLDELLLVASMEVLAVKNQLLEDETRAYAMIFDANDT